ncbi:MAG: hypothetical protein CM1200mP1_16940 [Candidatus Neomarinimicrobiota bacterium]|nr:MAG: hypothetical protein CM1200mP1_16940 [Candidatus Neomarinimicrobiota bacterium]
MDRVDPKHKHSIRWSNQLKSIGGLHPKIGAQTKELSNSVSNCREALKSFFDQMVGIVSIISMLMLNIQQN